MQSKCTNESWAETCIKERLDTSDMLRKLREVDREGRNTFENYVWGKLIN